MRHAVMMLTFAMAVLPAVSQTPAQKPAFEVVSIKARAASSPFFTGVISIAGGRLVANDNTLRALVFWAYRSSSGKPLLRNQIIGLPSWAEADHFDFQAKPEGESRSVAIDEMRAMVQGMLEDRFQLKLHRETREAPIYNLTVSKPGKIKLSADQSAAPPSTGPGGFDPRKPPARGTALGFITTSGGNLLSTMVATAVPISNLVDLIQAQVGRVVVDKTALNGLFDFNVKFTPEGAPSTAPVAGPGGQLPAADPQAPSLFTALQEELGLRLESAKGPVEVLVIDSVSKPSEN